MNRFTVLMAAAAVAASLAGFSQPSFAFGLHMPHIHVPHMPSPPPNPYGGWGR